MRNGDALYRVYAGISHLLTAWNTGGEGIHSPYLFHLVQMSLYDSHRYYCWDAIEALRRVMLSSDGQLDMVDRGTGISGSKRICDIAKHSLQSPRGAQMLFRLAVHLGREQREHGRDGLYIVELGTSLGITTAYLAAADSRNRVVTYEGCPAVAQIARRNWTQLGLRNITCIEGDIDDTFDDARTIDMAYLDANHTYDATVRYWSRLAKQAHDRSVFIFDDIHYSRGMYRAWQDVCADTRVTSTMDLGKMGLAFFDPHYLKKHYRLKI